MPEHSIRFHSDQKWHQCNHCNKSFGIKRDLTDHVKGVHEIKEPKVTCGLCDKKFLKGTLLRRHVKERHKINASDKIHKCDICDKMFGFARSLN